MYSTAPPILVKWLRAAGESSRLRLLALCADGGLSVSDLAQALKQSEPRVSRHLKILCEAGLLVRLRHGQWVHYRLAEGAEAASFVRGLLAQLDRGDPVLVRDRSGARAAAVPYADGVAHGAESRLGRALAEFAAAGGLSAPLKAVLVFGVGHPELLESAARASQYCTAIAHSRRAAQSARAFAEQRGFSCRVLRATSPDVLSETDLARAGAPFDAVLLDTFTSETHWRAAWNRRGACLRRVDGCGSSSAMNRSRGRASASWNIRSRGCAACWAMLALRASVSVRSKPTGSTCSRRSRALRPRPPRSSRARQGLGHERAPHGAPDPCLVRVLPASGCGDGDDPVELHRAPGAAGTALRVGDLRRGRLHARAHSRRGDAHPARHRAHGCTAPHLYRRLAQRDPRNCARLLGPGHSPPGRAAWRSAAGAELSPAARRGFSLRGGAGRGTGRGRAVRHLGRGLPGGASGGALGCGGSGQP